MTDDKKPEDKTEEIREKVEKRVAAEAEKLPPGDGGDPGPGVASSKFVNECLNANMLGDGMLFSELMNGQYLYNKTSKEWLSWSGHHWRLDIMDNAISAVEKVSQRYLKEAYDIVDSIDKAIEKGDSTEAAKLKSKQKIIYKRVSRLRDDSGRNSCLKFAHTNLRNGLSINGMELDQNPWLFACENGVVDLRTGDIRPGKPEDYLFRASPVEWKGIDEPAPAWETFLREIFQKKTEIIDFVLRLIGYGLTGLTYERFLPVFCGDGWNGKGTIIEIIMRVCGEYAAPIQSEMLLDQGRNTKNSSGVSPDIMALKGLRLALASETDEGRRFSTSKVKWLTGGDTLTGRNPYDRRPTSFLPTHTLFLITNHEPKAPAHDFAFWQRVFLIPFELSFVDNPKAENQRPRDKELMNKLTAESSGILASFVRGCLQWQQIGLDPPEEILKATSKYKKSLDHLSDFIDECCTIDPDESVGATDLYAEFEGWWETNISKTAPKQKTFGNWMANSKFERIKQGTYKYLGLGLKTNLLGE